MKEKKGKLRGEITVETAIVFTIILTLICTMIYMGMYVRDVVVIRSCCYGVLSEGLNENPEKVKADFYKKIKSVPLFVVKVSGEVEESLMGYSASVSYRMSGVGAGISKLLGSGEKEEKIFVQKSISYDAMCGYKALKDGINSKITKDKDNDENGIEKRGK